MNIPKTIKIGGHIINIILQNVKIGPDQGEFNSYYNQIRLEVEKDTPEDNVAECLLHEILEVVNKKNNLQMDHTVLTVLSENLFQILRDNKLIF